MDDMNMIEHMNMSTYDHVNISLKKYNVTMIIRMQKWNANVDYVDNIIQLNSLVLGSFPNWISPKLDSSQTDNFTTEISSARQFLDQRTLQP